MPSCRSSTGVCAAAASASSPAPRWAVPLVCMILLAPLTIVDVPPLLDYPNHLARAVVLAFGANDPVLSHMYAAHWAIIPDLGVDLTLPPLLHVLPVHVAGRVIIGCSVLLPVLGTIAYSRAVFGTRSLWPLGSALIAYNGTLLLGFLNFVAGIGLALLLSSAWIKWRELFPWQTIVLACAGAAGLFFCHLMSVVFCALLIGGYEAEMLWQKRNPWRALAALPVLVVPCVLYALSPLSPVAPDVAWPTLDNKVRELVMPFANYLLPLDLVTLVGVAGFLMIGRCRIAPASRITVVAVILLFLVAPNAVKGTYLFDTRFVIMLGFLVFGAVMPVRLRRAVIAVFAMLFVIRMSVVSAAWYEHRHDLAELRATITSVRPGTRVFLATVSPTEAPEYWRQGPLSRRLSLGLPLDDHVAALLLIEHRAYWPFLFDNPSQQPVVISPPYRQIAQPAESIATSSEVTDGQVNLRGYDDVLLLYAGGRDHLEGLAPNLTLIAKSDMAALFAIGQPRR